MEINKKGTLVGVITWSSIAILIAIGGDTRLAEAKNELRSVPNPAYVQSRPVYHKPLLHKPKLLLPKQLQQQKTDTDGSLSLQSGSNPHLITQTVYGFLDFITTVGNTVMVFTPQTKKVDLVHPSSSTQTRETVFLQPTQSVVLDIEELTSTTEVTKSSTHGRTPRLLDLDGDNPEEGSGPHALESSEYEPQVFPSVVESTPGSSSDLEYVNLMVDSSSAGLQLPTPTTPKPSLGTSESQPEVRSEVKVVTAVNIFETSTSSTAKGFTLKFSRPPSAPLASTVTKITTATAVRKSEEEFPTGLVSHNVETKVNNGVTTVHETKVLGTFIGTQYARVLESSSSVLPAVVTASRAPPTTPHPSTITLRKLPKLIDSVSEKVEFSTQRSVSRSVDLENDERFNEELLEDEEGPAETLDFEEAKLESSVIEPTPTATASEESTHYVLPLKDQKAQIYASPVPSPNAYSRQPEIYVDVSPAKAIDYVVTVTPSRKPFRPQNHNTRSIDTSRFNNRFSKNPSTTTESNELIIPQESTSEDSSRRSPSRFRNSRNRSTLKSKQSVTEVEILPTTVSVYSNNAVTATTARKFNSRNRSGNSPSNGKSGQEFKLGGRGGYSPATAARQLITPSSSTSVYRFKLNRPTGRWRFKPSPKPKVNIIKSREEEDPHQKEILQVSTSNGAVYPQGYNEHGETLEIQNVEEIRAESNELGQDVEPDLVPQTLRVATVTPTEFSDFESTRFLEIATIRSPYVFQAGNVKNTRYITVTKTFTKEIIVPTQASSSFGDASLENILATRSPYEKILEGSNNIATLPLIILGSDMSTPPLETVTQTFSTTQLMLKTSILPVLFDGFTTLYTLTQSYFVTRLVTAHKTIPPMELFNFVPTKSLTEFNTALQEAGSEHREQLIGSETEGNENDGNNEHFIIAPDELTSVGSDFDPSSMDEKFPRYPIAKSPKALGPSKPKSADQSGLPDLSNLSPDQLAFLRYFASGQQQQGLIPMQNYFQPPLLPSIQPQFPLRFASSPVIFNTVTTVVETKTLRIQFGSKPTQTTIYSTKIVPTRVTSYITASVPATPAIPNFFQPAPYPLAYVG